MKLLARLLRRFHSIETRSSASQLTLDFGTFPPEPLRCVAPAWTWNLVRLRSLGKAWQDLHVHRAVMRFVAEGGDVRQEEKAAREQFALMRGAFDKAASYPRMREALLRTVPFLLAMRSLLSRSRWDEATQAEGGYFNALRPNDVVVWTGNRKRLDEAAVISHEHIHLLQHRDGEHHGRYARNPAALLSDKALAIPQIQYFLERPEVEARLHECVLSFYRARGILPLTVSGFFDLLASNGTFGWLVADSLGRTAAAAEPPASPALERCTEFGRQLEILLLAIRTPELERRFIEEVLPVMYGNLLRYYGDEASSRQFMAQIERSDLYRELYYIGADC